MTRTHHILSIIVVALLWCPAVHAEKLKYEVLLFGKKIGETTVEVQDSAGGKYYRLRSNTAVKMLFVDKHSSMSTDVLFNKDGVMTSSVFKNIKEDGVVLTQVTWDKSKVQIDKNGEKSAMPGAVKYCSLSMYFREPVHMQKIFSERLGTYFEMVKESEGKYSAEVGNSSAVYTFAHGILTELEMKSALGSVYMKLVK
ncbi:MAG: hypothetical protein JWO03_2035 [Bacteroidetes bacterium]|nr:hypothetical protein [Bacteroidota bacterium]